MSLFINDHVTKFWVNQIGIFSNEVYGFFSTATVRSVKRPQ